MKRCFVVLFVAAIASAAFAQEEEGTGAAKGAQVNTTGKGYTAAYVIDAGSRRVLFEENAHVPLPTASMAKMMTCIIAMERIQSGEIKLDTPVTASARASKMGGSQIFAKEGQVFPMQTLLAATMIRSANDAAEMIAEKLGGSAEAFADLMNDKARALGLKETTFYDPHGLPNAADPKRINVSSAHDLAVMGQELMKYPLMREYAKTPWIPFTNATYTSGLTNPNHMINPKSKDYYGDATGIKTGYSGPAGYCITASAKRGDMEVIAVVMGARAPSGPESSFGIAARLFNDAFAHWRQLVALKKGTVVGQAAVADGQAKTVNAVAAMDVRTLVQRGQEGGITVRFVPSNLTAPVRAGQQVGFAVVNQGGQQIGRVPAMAQTAVEKQPWWKKFWPF
ncbi:MAG: D-alanyl-D-alanine carboxypeptidase [Acidobacteria bacterium]|nr:D-alanyl-D-alanine carboxypeptidase [Acidobacteriota bacterium]MBV9068898.1 D-alanyl-D-alanine carboxypeptidase [Acidobacteriota bacterium]MBV9185962.1 D-alanyl-D-alanine carboxypeptidase [Acidobacteriota bacterium]